ncbi:glutamine--fructose-6-phosphate transaminase (isomerizing) [Psychrilyobacter sp.]|uniref:glutamine--fructose-6-phosphate transaminase (isomerizing) n=1 Tax=Psychrilyobacter sp. TaxID=2586924 RepID=UPI0030178691
MCGIVGYVGTKETKDILYSGLSKLEYRGYDSAGISILSDEGLMKTFKSVGKLVNLGEIIKDKEILGHVGIGHTRWATHGVPSTRNSHPHNSQGDKLSLVHNGIIENYAELRGKLKNKGYKFLSDTDTEVIVHLLTDNYTGDLLESVFKILPILDGTYALGVISSDQPDLLVAARKGSPLVIGLGTEEKYIASDVPAILEYTDRVIFLEDGDVASLKKDEIKIWDLERNEKTIEETKIEWSLEAAEKGGYEHFTLKEIHEQPAVIAETLKGKIEGDSAIIDEITLTEEELKNITKIHMVACGTSYHAALIGKYMIEQELRIPVEVEVASEFRYKNPIIAKTDLVILISQSGETADTLAGLREAKKSGAKTIGIINIMGSTISREADGTIYINAGLEIGVASTKAFVSQLIALYILTLYLGEKKEILDVERRRYIIENLRKLPNIVEKILEIEEDIKKKSSILDGVVSSIFIGRNINTAIAYEGALKLKEISYIHAEGYQSGELKHGPIALINEDCPLIAIATKSDTYDKMKSNIEEVRARGGRVLAVATIGDLEIAKISDEVIYIPEIDELFSPVINVIPLQILSYYAAISRNVDVDKPRNLAKSVTVE